VRVQLLMAIHRPLVRAVALAACLVPWVVVAGRGSWGANNLAHGVCAQVLAVVVALASHDAVPGAFAIATTGGFTLSAIACFAMAGDAHQAGALLVVCIGASALSPCMASACSLSVRTRRQTATTAVAVAVWVAAVAAFALMFTADRVGARARVLCLCMAIVVLNSALFDCFSSALTKMRRALLAAVSSSATSAMQVVLSHGTGFATPVVCIVLNALYNVRTLSTAGHSPGGWCAVTFGSSLGSCVALALWDDLPAVRHALPALLCVSILGRMHGCTGEVYEAHGAPARYPTDVEWPCPSFVTSFVVIGGSAIMSAVIVAPSWQLPAVLAFLTVTSVLNHYYPYGAARYGAVDLLDRLAVGSAGALCTYYTVRFNSSLYAAATTVVASVSVAIYAHGTVLNTMSDRPNVAAGWQVSLHVVSAVGFLLVSVGVALDV
jgi:hypothetical protein